MVDMRSYINALKITWIRRYLNVVDSGWVNLFSKITTIQNSLVLEGGHANIVQPLKLAQCPNYFWIDVLNAWCSFVSIHEPDTLNDVLTNTLWYNHRIRVGKKTVYYKHWANKGVNFVCDLLDEKGDFLTLENVMVRSNIRTNFLQYGGMVKAVKHSFRNCFTGMKCNIDFPFIPFNLELLLQDKKGSIRIYNIFTSTKTVQFKFISKWDTKLNVDIPISKWLVFCRLSFMCTLDTKLRWFQYRLVHRILGVNSFLARIKINNFVYLLPSRK